MFFDTPLFAPTFAPSPIDTLSATPHLATKHHMVSHLHGPGNPALTGDNAVATYADVVSDLHQIIDLCPLPNYRVGHGPSIDCHVCSDLDVILYDDPAQLGNLFYASLTGNETKTVVPDMRSTVDNHAVSNERCLDPTTGADHAISPNFTMCSNHRVGADDRALTNLRTLAHNGTGLNGDVIFKFRVFVHHGVRRYAGRSAGKSQSFFIQLPGDKHECAPWRCSR